MTNTQNPNKNIRQFIFGSTESVVHPIGSDAAWATVHEVGRLLNGEKRYNEWLATKDDPPVKVVKRETKVQPCQRCGILVRKPEAGHRVYCAVCSAEMNQYYKKIRSARRWGRTETNDED